MCKSLKNPKTASSFFVPVYNCDSYLHYATAIVQFALYSVSAFTRFMRLSHLSCLSCLFVMFGRISFQPQPLVIVQYIYCLSLKGQMSHQVPFPMTLLTFAEKTAPYPK